VVLLKVPGLQTLVRIARIEQRRKSPLDETSARLLAANFSHWNALFPYFENLPGLGHAEFHALESFTQTVASFPSDRKRAVLGEWDSLVELIARAAKAGSIDAELSARAFREACESLTAPDHPAKAIAILSEIGGTGSLRFTPEQRAKFQRVLALQGVPPAATASPQDAMAALSGLVYAASLDPGALLVNEDPRLLAKHQFAGDAGELFPPATLVRSSRSPGSYLRGAFVNIDEIARDMSRAGGGAPSGEAAPASPGTPAGDGEDRVAADFRAEGRLVEVYATVTDSHGHYIDDLRSEQFSVLDRGQPRPLVAFESRSTELSVALVLDTTASMAAALPALKVAALRLIRDLRGDDRVAVYSFNDKVSELVSFSADKDAAKRAVLHTGPFGETALYDALTRVNRDLASRTGKKVVVVFTDGDDNASTLTADAAIQRAKAAGVPVYTVAQGAALINPEYLKQLAEVSQATGGASYAIHNHSEIRDVFEKISQEMMHTYFFAFRPEGAESHEYRPIDVLIRGGKHYKVRAREGYYPE
jgi:Ca-activated chloride channel family protein